MILSQFYKIGLNLTLLCHHLLWVLPCRY